MPLLASLGVGFGGFKYISLGTNTKHFATMFYTQTVSDPSTYSTDNITSNVLYLQTPRVELDNSGNYYFNWSQAYQITLRDYWRGGTFKFLPDGTFSGILDNYQTDGTALGFGVFNLYDGKLYYSSSTYPGHFKSFTLNGVESTEQYRTTNQAGSQIKGAKFAPSGNYYTVSQLSTASDILITKANTAGNGIAQHSKTNLYGPALMDIDSSENLYFGGGTGGGGQIWSFDSSLDPRWSFTWTASGDGSSTDRTGLTFIHYASSNNSILFGTRGGDAAGSEIDGIGTVRADTGQRIWSKSLYNTGIPLCGTSDPDGNFYLGIARTGNPNTVLTANTNVLKVNTTGSIVWSRDISCTVKQIKYIDGDLVFAGIRPRNNEFRQLILMRVPADGSKTGNYFSGRLHYKDSSNVELTDSYTSSNTTLTAGTKTGTFSLTRTTAANLITTGTVTSDYIKV